MRHVTRNPDVSSEGGTSRHRVRCLFLPTKFVMWKFLTHTYIWKTYVLIRMIWYPWLGQPWTQRGTVTPIQGSLDQLFYFDIQTIRNIWNNHLSCLCDKWSDNIAWCSWARFTSSVHCILNVHGSRDIIGSSLCFLLLQSIGHFCFSFHVICWGLAMTKMCTRQIIRTNRTEMTLSQFVNVLVSFYCW